MVLFGDRNNRMKTDGFHKIPDVSWTIRSLIAGGAIAVCIFMFAISVTKSANRIEQQKIADIIVADEAKLIADYASFLAAETENARVSFEQPRLKPASRGVAMNANEVGIADLVAFDFTEMEVAASDAEERLCLAQAIYYEARSERRIGQLAVADVILNRVKTSVYPDSICGVVFQGSERVTGCQFSFTCDGSMEGRLNKRLWKRSEELSAAILAGMRLPVTRNATHYHADYVSPPWAKTLTPTATIGTHKFYRFPSKRTVAAAPAAM